MNSVQQSYIGIVSSYHIPCFFGDFHTIRIYPRTFSLPRSGSLSRRKMLSMCNFYPLTNTTPGTTKNARFRGHKSEKYKTRGRFLTYRRWLLFVQLHQLVYGAFDSGQILFRAKLHLVFHTLVLLGFLLPQLWVEILFSR